MTELREACIQLLDGISRQAIAPVDSAMTRLDRLDCHAANSREIYPADSVTGATQLSPDMYFTAEYADYLLLNGFTLAVPDDANMLRAVGDNAAPVVFHSAVPSGGTLTYRLTGADEMEMLIVSASAPLHAEVFDRSDTPEVSYLPGTLPGASFSAWLSWDMREEGPIDFSVTNPSAEAVTFMIAFR